MSNDDELKIDYEAKAPAPLDPAIANTFLKLVSNKFSDGFDIEVSAFFGSEAVELSGEKLQLEVILRIKRASLQMLFQGCSAVPALSASDLSDEWELTQKRSSKRSVGTKAVAKAGVQTENLTPSPTFGGELEARNENAVSSDDESMRKTRNWSLNSNTSVLIGKNESFLDGLEVDNFRGWRAKPNYPNQPCAVASILSVRKGWIEISEVEVGSLAGKLGKKVKALVSSKKEREKALFNLLLEALVLRGLQQRDGSKEANLAVSVQVLRPSRDIDEGSELSPSILPNQQSSSSLGIDASMIESFLNATPKEAVGLLQSLGVSKVEIDQKVSGIDKKPVSSRGVFTAGSTPLRALEGLRFLARNGGKVSDKEAYGVLNKRTITDLKNLGLLKAKGGFLISDLSSEAEIESAVRLAAAKAPGLQIARKLIIEDQNFSGIEICDAFSEEVGKVYSTDGSKLRVGNALLRWTFWLEPHLVDPSGGSKSAMRLLAARSQESKLGRRTFATEENVQTAQEALSAGKTLKEIGELIGVSPNTVSVWIKRGILERTM